MNRKIIPIKLFLISSLAITSCKKFVDLSVPQDRVIASRVFESDVKALSAVSAIYGNMINGSSSFANSFTTIYAGLSADELLKFNPSVVDEEFQVNSIKPNNSVLSSIWRSAYQSIYYANSIIEGLNKSSEISKTLKEQLVGECKFIRAFSYFYLVNFFGNVPLVTTTDYNINQFLPRSSINEVYSFMIQDVMDAKNSLPASYNTTGNSRPTKFAASSLLARLYLFNEEWEKAEEESSQIIGSGTFTPLMPLENVFLKNSKEAIWYLTPLNGLLKETALLKPSGSPLTPKFYLPNSFRSKFELNDKRVLVWLDSMTYQNEVFYFPNKYRNIQATVSEYYIVFRISEIFLIRAEARLNKGKLTDAIDDLNIIRSRAGLQDLAPGLLPSEIQSAIISERQSELFVEWGNRWFDLKRWDMTQSILMPIKQGWQNTDVLYPIPLEEILANKNLVQNPGY